ncbi:MAG: radical SAM protein [Oscillospiraceae bacterium]|jgi:uncharacterized radical SAM superfamily Fe-S cluster-containing enzyme|nr:radical SAM protein [Oscillospiraceae bacterium]
MTIISNTRSVCPKCLTQIDAQLVREGDDVYLRKSCPSHGDFSTIVWRGMSDEFDNWWKYKAPSGDAPNCPNDCGLCAKHLQKTCCALVEVTSRCNLRCPVCFADAGSGTSEPTVAELYETFKRLCRNGNTFVQLSGGEPTMRDNLPEIVSAARRAGCETVQLNSNGIRLGREPEFVRALADAGLSFVFMQFDGTCDEVHKTLRGQPLLSDKLAAIEVCSKLRLGVTLVPTLVPGVNMDDVGGILRFAVEHAPAVRGVHFQPISYFGRFPHPPRDEDRVTLPEVLRAIETQTDGKFKIANFVPSSCDHPRCGFHGDFVILPKGLLMKLTPKYNPDACCAADSHLKNRKFVARRWTRPKSNGQKEATDYHNMDNFLARVKSHGFTVSAMAFQDAYTLEIDRLRRCSLHVIDGEKTVPFCARYITQI